MGAEEEATALGSRRGVIHSNSSRGQTDTLDEDSSVGRLGYVGDTGELKSSHKTGLIGM